MSDVWLMIGAGAALFAAGTGLEHYCDRRRTEGLWRTARQWAFTFTPTLKTCVVGDLANCPLFKQGHSPQIRNLMRGETDELSLCVFDYRYSHGYGHQKVTVEQTVACFESPQLNLPQFSLSPRTPLHLLLGWVGQSAVEFPGLAPISNRYVVYASDEDHLRKRLQSSLIEYLEETKGLHIEGNGRQIAVYREGRRVSPQKLRSMLEEAFAIYRLLRHESPPRT